MRMGKVCGLVLALSLGSGLLDAVAAPQLPQRPQRFITFNIVFDDNCDGMNLRLGDGGFAFGTHTGCNAGELLIGRQFQTGDETGVSVPFFENASGLLVRYDIYRTGFRAGRFYVYQLGTERLLRYGTYSPAPVDD